MCNVCILTPLFPLKFCVYRWVDNEPVAERVIDLWDSVVLLIKDYLARPANKRPQNNTSYDVLVIAYKDSLMLIKLHVFHGSFYDKLVLNCISERCTIGTFLWLTLSKILHKILYAEKCCR